MPLDHSREPSPFLYDPLPCSAASSVRWGHLAGQQQEDMNAVMTSSCGAADEESHPFFKPRYYLETARPPPCSAPARPEDNKVKDHQAMIQKDRDQHMLGNDSILHHLQGGGQRQEQCVILCADSCADSSISFSSLGFPISGSLFRANTDGSAAAPTDRIGHNKQNEQR